MKKHILKFTMILLVLIGSISSCGKDDDLDMSNIENLYAQPLSVIQKCVQGKWEVKYIIGGYMGKTPVSDKFIEINDNKINGRKFQWEKYTIPNMDGSSFSTYAIHYIELDEPSLYFGSIEKDTLSIGYIGGLPNCYDCYTGELWVRTK